MRRRTTGCSSFNTILHHSSTNYVFQRQPPFIPTSPSHQTWDPPCLSPHRRPPCLPYLSRRHEHRRQVGQVRHGKHEQGTELCAVGRFLRSRRQLHRYRQCLVSRLGSCRIHHLLTRILSNSQNETSEEFIGEWMEQRGIRDQIVLATKASYISSV